MTKQLTAWFGNKHPAEGRGCPACGARVGKPCISRIGMPGTCVGEGVTLAGMHAERVVPVMNGEAGPQ